MITKEYNAIINLLTENVEINALLARQKNDGVDTTLPCIWFGGVPENQPYLPHINFFLLSKETEAFINVETFYTMNCRAKTLPESNDLALKVNLFFQGVQRDACGYTFTSFCNILGSIQEEVEVYNTPPNLRISFAQL